MYTNENVDNKKIITMIILLIVLLVIAVLVYFFVNNIKNYDEVKIDPDKAFVYKKEIIGTGKDKSLPVINVKGSYVEKVNSEIAKLEEDYIELTENKIGFVFNKSKNILSLSIKKIDNYNSYNHPTYSFQTYIINLDTKEEFTKEEIYQKYQVNDEAVSKSIKLGFTKMYKDLTKKGYLDGNCNYECYLRWRGVSDDNTDANLYIENNELIAFKGFNRDSVFGEENYYTDKNFKFSIIK